MVESIRPRGDPGDENDELDDEITAEIAFGLQDQALSEINAVLHSRPLKILISGVFVFPR